MIRLYFIAVAAGLLAATMVYQSIKQVGRVEGVTKERARVETEGKKIDAKAKKARATVAARPAPSVLDGQWRD